MKTLANRGFCKKKLDTRFDTHCIKTGVQLCLKEQHLIQVGGNKTAARTQYKVFNAAVFLPSINILYFHPLKMHTPNL
nr:MAG TPA: hypothetical protein [Caudoviricetes sp.]